MGGNWLLVVGRNFPIGGSPHTPLVGKTLVHLCILKPRQSHFSQDYTWCARSCLLRTFMVWPNYYLLHTPLFLNISHHFSPPKKWFCNKKFEYSLRVANWRISSNSSIQLNYWIEYLLKGLKVISTTKLYLTIK